jgi:hypothetical protein
MIKPLADKLYDKKQALTPLEMNRALANKFNTGVNQKLKEIFPNSKFTSHDMRSLYIQVSTQLYKPQNLSKEQFTKEMLAHDNYLSSSYSQIQVHFSKDPATQNNIQARLDEYKIDTGSIRAEVKALDDRVADLKQAAPLINTNPSGPTVMLDGVKVRISSQTRNKGSTDIIATIADYKKVRQQPPTKAWLRTEGKYSSNLVNSAAVKALLV